MAEYFGFAKYDRTSIATAKKGDGAFVDGLEAETQGTIDTLINELGFQLYHDGTGNRARILSGSGTATVTLYQARDTANFEVGMSVITDADPGTGAITNTGAAVISADQQDCGYADVDGQLEYTHHDGCGQQLRIPQWRLRRWHQGPRRLDPGHRPVDYALRRGPRERHGPPRRTPRWRLGKTI